MFLTLTGELLGAAALLPRSPGDKKMLLVQVRDPESGETLKLVCPDEPQLRERLSAAAATSNARCRPTLTFSLKATQLSLSGLTGGKVVGNAYQLLVVAIAEGSPALRSQPEGAEKQAAELPDSNGDNQLVFEPRRRPH